MGQKHGYGAKKLAYVIILVLDQVLSIGGFLNNNAEECYLANKVTDKVHITDHWHYVSGGNKDALLALLPIGHSASALPVLRRSCILRSAVSKSSILSPGAKPGHCKLPTYLLIVTECVNYLSNKSFRSYSSSVGDGSVCRNLLRKICFKIS